MMKYFLLIIIVLNSFGFYSQETDSTDSLLFISVKNVGCLDIEKVNFKIEDSTYTFENIKIGETSAAQIMRYVWTNNHIAVWISPPKPLFYNNKIGLQSAFIKSPIDFIGESKLTNGQYTVTLKVCKKKRKQSKRQRRWSLERNIESSN